MTVIQPYSVIHCQLPTPSLTQPQAAQSDKPPRHPVLCYFYPFPVCAQAAPVLICCEALETHLDRELWTVVQVPHRGARREGYASVLFKGYQSKKRFHPVTEPVCLQKTQEASVLLTADSKEQTGWTLNIRCFQICLDLFQKMLNSFISSQCPSS